MWQFDIDLRNTEKVLQLYAVFYSCCVFWSAASDGAPGGNTATTTVNIKVTDVNDNIPTLEKDEVHQLFLSPDSYIKRELGFSVKRMLVQPSMLLNYFVEPINELNKCVKSQMFI